MNKPMAVTAAALCAFAALSPTDSAAQTTDTWKWQASLYVSWTPAGAWRIASDPTSKLDVVASAAGLEHGPAPRMP